MLVKDLFERLSYGQLSNLTISNEGSGVIRDTSIPKLILYANEGLLKLYSKYILLEKNLIIEQVEHIINYRLIAKYAITSDSDEQFKFIKDIPTNVFEDDVIKILEVYDSIGQLRTLNDKEDSRSLFTPQPNTLQVPNPIGGQGLGVLYQARHPVLNTEADDDSDILEQDIDLPFFLEGALQFYIASRVYSDMNGQENKIASQEHLVNYEMICAELETKDLINSTHHTTHQKLSNRGFP